MKCSKYLAIIPLAFSLIGIAQAKGDIFYKVPFNNVEISAASKIYVNYDFNSNKQTLVCEENTKTSMITSAEWSYKDATRKIALPITLKDNSRFSKGHFADPEGNLVITNEFGPDSVFVNCYYRKMA